MATLSALQEKCQFDEDTLTAVKIVRDSFIRKLGIARDKQEISKELIPKKEAREALQKSLASIARARPAFYESNLGLLDEIIRLLSSVISTGICDPEQAQKIRSAFSKLEPKSGQSMSSIVSNKLSELIHA